MRLCLLRYRLNILGALKKNIPSEKVKENVHFHALLLGLLVGAATLEYDSLFLI